MNFNFQKISSDISKTVPERTADVILRRFGLKNQERETLEAIGESYSITRERVRQIEEEGFSRLKPLKEKYEGIFSSFKDYLEQEGGLKREDVLLANLGKNKYQNQVYFLLTLGDPFKRFSETKDLHTFWTISQTNVELAQKTIEAFFNTLKEAKQPIDLESYKPSVDSISPQAVMSYIELSKGIQKGSEGLFGLREWPEINPRGLKDKAYLVFKKENKPLHFTDVSNLIGSLNFPKGANRPVNVQTVHNELIRDPRFVLVGRGMYALKDWGYEPGIIRDLIVKILQENKEPIARDEIIAKVLKQRMVKENTILLNLQNKQYFTRDSQGRYAMLKKDSI